MIACGTTNLPAEAGALQKNCLPRLLDGSVGLMMTDEPKTVTKEFASKLPPVQAIVISLLGTLAKLPAFVQTRLSGRSILAWNAPTSGPAVPATVHVPFPSVLKKT